MPQLSGISYRCVCMIMRMCVRAHVYMCACACAHAFFDQVRLLLQGLAQLMPWRALHPSNPYVPLRVTQADASASTLLWFEDAYVSALRVGCSSPADGGAPSSTLLARLLASISSSSLNGNSSSGAGLAGGAGAGLEQCLALQTGASSTSSSLASALDTLVALPPATMDLQSLKVGDGRIVPRSRLPTGSPIDAEVQLLNSAGRRSLGACARAS